MSWHGVTVVCSCISNECMAICCSLAASLMPTHSTLSACRLRWWKQNYQSFPVIAVVVRARIVNWTSLLQSTSLFFVSATRSTWPTSVQPSYLLAQTSQNWPTSSAQPAFWLWIHNVIVNLRFLCISFCLYAPNTSSFMWGIGGYGAKDFERRKALRHDGRLIFERKFMQFYCYLAEAEVLMASDELIRCIWVCNACGSGLI